MRILGSFLILIAFLALSKADGCLTGAQSSCGVSCNVQPLIDFDISNTSTLVRDLDTNCVYDSMNWVLVNSSDNSDNDTQPGPCFIVTDGVKVESDCDMIVSSTIMLSPSRFKTEVEIKRSAALLGDVYAISAVTQDDSTSINRVVITNLTSEDVCRLGYCKDCKTKADFMACQLNNFGFWRTIIAIIVCLTILACLPWLYPIIRVMIGCCRGIRCVCRCCCKRNGSFEELSHFEMETQGVPLTTTTIVTTDSSFDIDSDGLTEMVDSPPVVPPKPILNGGTNKMKTKRVKTVGSKSKALPLSVQTLVCFIALTSMFAYVAASCQGIPSASSLIPFCYRVNSRMVNCTVRPTLSGSLLGVGMESCLDLVVEGNKVGSMVVRLDSFTVSTSLVKSYYTSSWELLIQAVRRCRGASGANCNRYSSPKGCANCQQLNPCSQLPGGDIFNYPGESGCLDGPTCSCAAGSGNACQNYRFSFKPTGSILGLYRPSSSAYTASIGFNVTIGESSKITKISTVSPLVNTDQATIQLNSLFVNSLPSFDERFVACIDGSTNCRLVFAAGGQNPQINIIGDIQSGTLAGLQSPNSGSFIWSRSLISLNPTCDGLAYSLAPKGFDKFSGYPTFPTTWAGFSYTVNPASSKMDAPVSMLSSASYTYAAKANFTYSVIVALVVPSKVTVGEIKGCFSCTKGANVTISLWSTAEPGVCVLSSRDGFVNPQTLELRQTSTEYPLWLDYSIQSVDDLLMVSCNGGTETFVVKGTLIDENTIIPNDPNSPGFIGNQKPPSSISIKLPWSLNNLFGLGKVFSTIFWIVIAVIVIAVLFFVVIKVINCGSMKDKTIPQKIKTIFVGKKTPDDGTNVPLVD